MKKKYLLFFFFMLCAACSSQSGNYVPTSSNAGSERDTDTAIPSTRADNNTADTAMNAHTSSGNQGNNKSLTYQRITIIVDSMMDERSIIDTVKYAITSGKASMADSAKAVIKAENGYDNNDLLSGPSIWILLIFSVLFIIVFYMLINQNMVMSRLLEKNDSLRSQPPLDITQKQLDHLGILSDVDKKIMSSNLIQDMVRQIEDLSAKVDVDAVEKQLPVYEPVSELAKNESLPRSDTFYMSGPVESPQGNYFPVTAKSLTKENTVYKFTLIKGKAEALFDVHTGGASADDIVRMVQSYIKPACAEENLPGTSVKSIRTIKSGKAVLEGDKWIIKEKALIRYE